MLKLWIRATQWHHTAVKSCVQILFSHLAREARRLAPPDGLGCWAAGGLRDGGDAQQQGLVPPDPGTASPAAGRLECTQRRGVHSAPTYAQLPRCGSLFCGAKQMPVTPRAADPRPAYPYRHCYNSHLITHSYSLRSADKTKLFNLQWSPSSTSVRSSSHLPVILPLNWRHEVV
jgi:hypothetical protein